MLFSGVLFMKEENSFFLSLWKVKISKVFNHLSNGKEVPVDTEKIRDIYDRYFDTIYRICFLYMKNEADTLDAVQETFLRLMQSGFKEYSQEKNLQYDLIQGRVANDKVFRVVDMYHSGIWDKERALKEIKVYSGYDQIAFITQKAIDQLLYYESFYEVM